MMRAALPSLLLLCSTWSVDARAQTASAPDVAAVHSLFMAAVEAQADSTGPPDRLVDRSCELVVKRIRKLAKRVVTSPTVVTGHGAEQRSRATSWRRGLKLGKPAFSEWVCRGGVRRIWSRHWPKIRSGDDSGPIVDALMQVTHGKLAVDLLSQYLGLGLARGSGGGLQGWLAGLGSGSAGSPPVAWSRNWGTRGIPGLAVESIQLLSDVGYPGGGNGVIDAGEWVQIGVVVKNTSKRPLFSTSVTIRASTNAWTWEIGETELGEMLSKGSTAALEPFWVYVSEGIGDRAAAHVTLSFRDTHRTAGSSQLRLGIPVRRFTEIELGSVTLDLDWPGYSEQGTADGLVPQSEAELSASIVGAPRDVTGARLEFRFPAPASGIFAKTQRIDAPLHPTGGGRFEAGDDLDVTIVNEKKLDAAVKRLRGHEATAHWVFDRHAIVWVEAQITVVATQRERRAGEASTPAGGEPADPSHLPASDVIDLVQSHTSLAPRPAAPRVEGSLSATDGYEISFDEEAFAKEYRDRTAPAVRATSEEPPKTYSSSYTLRRYFPLRVSGWPKPKPKPKPVVQLRQVCCSVSTGYVIRPSDRCPKEQLVEGKRCRERVCCDVSGSPYMLQPDQCPAQKRLPPQRCERPSEPLDVVLQFGLATEIWTAGGGAEAAGMERGQSATAVGWDARIEAGRAIRGVMSMRSVQIEVLEGGKLDGNTIAKRSRFGLGVGLPLGDEILEIEPWALLHLMWLTFDEREEERRGLELGVTARYLLGEAWALQATAMLAPFTHWPASGTFDAAIDGGAFGIDVGLAITF